MRQLLQIFFGLLIPLTGLFVVLSIGYYSLEYDFSKAIKLAMLVGVILGFGISLISSIVIFILRWGRSQEVMTYKEQQEEDKKIIHQHEKIKVMRHEDSGFIEKDFILLMDKRLAYEISLYAIKKEKLGKEGHKYDFDNGIISVKNRHDIIKMTISHLTKHTVKVFMQYKNDSTHATAILESIKTREKLFLDYT